VRFVSLHGPSPVLVAEQLIAYTLPGGDIVVVLEILEVDRRLVGVHGAGSEDEQTRPDQVECAHHVGNPFSNFLWEELFFFAIDHELLDGDVVGVAKPIHDDAKEESSEAKTADDKSANHANSVLQMTPAGLQRRRVHQRLANSEGESVAIDEDSRACDERAEVYQG